MTIRYLHVIQTLDPRSGGPAEGVKQLTTAAIRMQHHVEIAVLEPPDSPWAEHFQCPVHYVGPIYGKYGYAPKLAAWLRRNVHRFGAVVVNGIWQYHSWCTWRLLRNSTTPYFVFAHGMLDPWFKRRYPLKHLKKSLYWALAEQRVLRDARAVLFTSDEERLLARTSFQPYRVNELVVNYGVPAPTGDADLQREMFLQQFPSLRNSRVLLFMSRIHPKKGCNLLVEAFAAAAQRDSSLRLVMAGPDQVGMQRGLRTQVERLGLGHVVVWPGMLAGDMKLGALHAAEAFVLPSHQENFGIAVAEALAAGLPVLISNRVNIWREIVADHAGLVGDDTGPGITRLLLDWLDLSAERRSAMASNARSCFERRFHIDAAAASVLAAIEQHGYRTPRLAVA